MNKRDASGVTEREDRRVRRLYVVGPSSSSTSVILDAFSDAGFDADAAEELGAICDEARADKPVIVLVGDDYLDVLYGVAAHGAGCPVVILTHFEYGIDFMTALQAGASGFCEPDASPDAIVRTVRDVLAHGTAIPRHLVAMLVEQLRHGRGRVVATGDGVVEVTEREWEVLSLMRLGRSTAEIADLLFVSAATIRSHVWALVRKLGVEDRAALNAVLDQQAANADR